MNGFTKVIVPNLGALFLRPVPEAPGELPKEGSNHQSCPVVTLRKHDDYGGMTTLRAHKWHTYLPVTNSSPNWI